MSEIPEGISDLSSEPQGKAPSLGLLLQKAREARGLTIDDVVQTLKFSPRQIEALEANDMSALPGGMFVRGVVRSYARFLKLDPEPLLALLATEAPLALPDVRPPDNMGNAMPNSGLRQVPPLVAFSVVLLIASAIMVGWHFLGINPLGAIRTVEPPVEPAGTAVPVPESSVPVAITPPPVSASEPTVSSPATVEVTAATDVDTKQLAFRFRGKSWVEVRDAKQQVILTGQYMDGGSDVVAGRPPFQIVIGNAPNVSLVYGDHPVDLKPHTRAEVARFTLD